MFCYTRVSGPDPAHGAAVQGFGILTATIPRNLLILLKARKAKLRFRPRAREGPTGAKLKILTLTPKFKSITRDIEVGGRVSDQHRASLPDKSTQS